MKTPARVRAGRELFMVPVGRDPENWKECEGRFSGDLHRNPGVGRLRAARLSEEDAADNVTRYRTGAPAAEGSGANGKGA